MIIKAVETGRGWGDKRDMIVRDVVVHGAKCRVTEYDSWCGGEGHQRGEYMRVTSLQSLERCDVWPRAHDRGAA